MIFSSVCKIPYIENYFQYAAAGEFRDIMTPVKWLDTAGDSKLFWKRFTKPETPNLIFHYTRRITPKRVTS